MALPPARNHARETAGTVTTKLGIPTSSSAAASAAATTPKSSRHNFTTTLFTSFAAAAVKTAAGTDILQAFPLKRKVFFSNHKLVVTSGRTVQSSTSSSGHHFRKHPHASGSHSAALTIRLTAPSIPQASSQAAGPVGPAGNSCSSIGAATNPIAATYVVAPSSPAMLPLPLPRSFSPSASPPPLPPEFRFHNGARGVPLPHNALPLFSTASHSTPSSSSTLSPSTAMRFFRPILDYDSIVRNLENEIERLNKEILRIEKQIDLYNWMKIDVRSISDSSKIPGILNDIALELPACEKVKQRLENERSHAKEQCKKMRHEKLRKSNYKRPNKTNSTTHPKNKEPHMSSTSSATSAAASSSSSSSPAWVMLLPAAPATAAVAPTTTKVILPVRPIQDSTSSTGSTNPAVIASSSSSSTLPTSDYRALAATAAVATPPASLPDDHESIIKYAQEETTHLLDKMDALKKEKLGLEAQLRANKILDQNTADARRALLETTPESEQTDEFLEQDRRNNIARDTRINDRVAGIVKKIQDLRTQLNKVQATLVVATEQQQKIKQALTKLIADHIRQAHSWPTGPQPNLAKK